MDIPSGYDFIELRESDDFQTIVLARSLLYKNRVIIKSRALHAEDKAPPLKREFSILHKLDHPNIVRALDYTVQNSQEYLILEEISGDKIADSQLNRGEDISGFIDIALPLTGALCYLHTHGICHADIRPENIIIDRSGRSLKLINFYHSFIPRKENPPSPDLYTLPSLRYISPELTGRTNTPPDQRADLYSLGMTFMMILTGTHPVRSMDPQECMHFHLAKMPPPLRRTTPSVPEVLSDIVTKLISKSSDDRYHNSCSLLDDLKSFNELSKHNSGFFNFKIADTDFSDHPVFTNRLYGRLSEREQLEKTIKKIEAGYKGILFVHGESGIGKTSLIEDTLNRIQFSGFIISGKYFESRPNVPYDALIWALKNLAERVLMLSNDEILTWKEALNAAIAPNGYLITELIPEWNLILGEQSRIVDLPLNESKNRFQYVFMNFIKAITEKKSLLLFLDDVQRADPQSLSLLKELFIDTELRRILVIASYRDGQINSDHPLNQFKSEMNQFSRERSKRIGLSIATLNVSPLRLDEVREMIRDILFTRSDKIESLVLSLYKLSRGNPFELIQQIRSLFEEGHLRFDSKNRSWSHDSITIQDYDAPEVNFDALTSRLHSLPSETYLIVRAAACVGENFDIPILSSVLSLPTGSLEEHLASAIDAGLIAVRAGTDRSFHFTHDRIRQKAYDDLEESDRLEIHLKIGRTMLTGSSPGDGRLLEITHHLNTANRLIDSPEERIELAWLNLRATKKTIHSSAFHSAVHYALSGISMLPENPWKDHYGLSYELHLTGAEVTCLTGDYEQLTLIKNRLLDNAKDAVDRARVYGIEIQSLIARSKFSEALEAALNALRIYGIHVPSNPSKLHMMMEILKTRLALTGTDMRDLGNLPKIRDPLMIETMSLLNITLSVVYIASPSVFPLLIMIMLRNTLKHGITDSTPYVYAVYGLILSGLLGKIPKGYDYGSFALKLLNTTNRSFSTKTEMIFNVFIRHWKEHLKETLRPLMEGYYDGLEKGDYEYAGYNIYKYCSNLFFCGMDLNHTDQETEKYIDEVLKIRQNRPLNALLLHRQMNLLLKADDPGDLSLNGKYFNENIDVPRLIQSKDFSTTAVFFGNKLMLLTLFDRTDGLEETITMKDRYIRSLTGVYNIALYNFYSSLALLKLYGRSDSKNGARILRKVSLQQKALKKWSDHAPENFLHKFCLVEGEKARLTGRLLEAERNYSLAIKLAKDNGFLNEEALAREMSASFWLDRGFHDLAFSYANSALACYLRWGATAKVNHLHQKFSSLFSHPASSRYALGVGANDSSSFDIQSIMKASGAISKEILLPRLLEKLINFLMENAGAERCLILLEREGHLYVEAEGQAGNKSHSVMRSIPVVSHNSIPQNLIHYATRIEESVIEGCAFRHGRFTHDPYISKNSIRSILCLPLINRGNLLGLLYLENNLMDNMFQERHIEILKLLSGQIITSIRNAQLFQKHIESEERFRTILKGSPLPIIITRFNDGKILYANDPAFFVFEISREDALNSSSTNFFANPADREELIKILTEEGRIYNYEIRLKTATGKELWALLSQHTFVYEGEPSLINIINDITKRKNDEEELRRYRNKLEIMVERRTNELKREMQERIKAEEGLRLASSVFENTVEGIMIIDERGEIESVNPAFSVITGYKSEEVIGKNAKLILPDRSDSTWFSEILKSLKTEKNWAGEIYGRKKSGEEYSQWVSLATVHGSEDVLNKYVVILDDISRKREHEELLRHKAFHDSLTGIANREYFLTQLTEIAADSEKTGKGFALVFIDLDGFKSVNDRLGHSHGDRLLQMIARRMESSLREFDLCCRYGGDEFLVLLKDIESEPMAIHFTERIIEALNIDYSSGDTAMKITASAGIGFYPRTTADTMKLIEYADEAMYRAKSEGKNGYEIAVPH